VEKMARPKLGDSESKRLQMVITEDEIAAIEDWQFKNRMPSKSEAIRRLVQIGLRTEREIPKLLDKFLKTSFVLKPPKDKEDEETPESRTERMLTEALVREMSIFSVIKDIANEIEPFVHNPDLTKALAEADRIIDEPGTLARLADLLHEKVKIVKERAAEAKE
jgi:antitoxin component HigA of HigAB toxin-antitoxin module